MATNADRVPVIRIASTHRTIEAAMASNLRGGGMLAKSQAESGKALTAYSAKKLRLTKVDAGAAPWGNQRKSNQNCSATHSDATKAPACMPHSSVGRFSRVSTFSPSHSSKLNKNQRIASTPAR